MATHGFYEIKKIKYNDKETNYYYDVSLLATEATYTNEFAELSSYKNEIKCCWTGGLNIANKLNGFGRVIRYKDSTKGGESPEYIVIMWEGQLEKGIPKGFSRYIYGLLEI